MPIMPFVDESQKMVPGSPVPVGGEQEARMQGQALNNLGQAMFNLGDALDLAAKKAKDDKEKLAVLDAVNKFRFEALREKAKRDAAPPIDNDPTGFGQVDEYKTNLTPVMDEIGKNLSDSARAKFMAQAGDVLVDTSTQLLAGEVKKREEQNKVMLGQIVSDYGANAKFEPANLEYLMGKAEEAVRQSGQFSGAFQQLKVNEARKQVLNDGIEGHISKALATGNSQYYDLALQALEAYSPGVMSPEEKTKMRDEIYKQKWEANTRALQDIKLQEANAKKEHDRVEVKLLGTYAAQLKLAGNSDFARNPILAQIQKDVLAGNISEEKGRALQSAKIFADVGDDRYEANTLAKAFASGGKPTAATIEAAMTQVRKDMGVRVSFDRSAKLINELEKWRDIAQKNPERAQLIQAGEDIIKAEMQEALNPNSMMDQMQKQSLVAKVQKNVASYHQWILGHPDVDPIGQARWIYEHSTGIPIPGNESKMGRRIWDSSSLEKTQESIDKLKTWYDGVKANNQLTDKIRQDYRQQRLDLENKKKRFLNLQPATPPISTLNSPAPTASPGASGGTGTSVRARGR